jgi:hypothetical protein
MNPSFKSIGISLLILSISFLSGQGQSDPQDVFSTSLYISEGQGVGLFIDNGGDSGVALTIQGALINNGAEFIQQDDAVILLKNGTGGFKGSLQNLRDSARISLSGLVQIEGDLKNEGSFRHSSRLVFLGDSTQYLYGLLIDSNAIYDAEISKAPGAEIVWLNTDVDVQNELSFTGPGCIVTDSTILYLRNVDTNAIMGFLSPGDYTSISRTVVTMGSYGGLKREIKTGWAYDFPVSNSSYYNPLMVKPLNGPDTSDVLIRLEPYQGASINFSGSYDSLPCQPGTLNLNYNCFLQNGTWRIDGRDDGWLTYQLFTYPHNSSFSDCLLGAGLNYRTLRSPNPNGDWSTYVDSVENSHDMCMYLNVLNLQDLEGVAVPGGIYDEFSSIGVGAGPSSGIGLPVEWLYFDVSSQENNAILDWATGVEINNAGFEIYRSKDAVTFERIAFVSPSSNPQEFSEYQFIDRGLEFGHTYYYQLKQIDQDGGYDLSELEFVRINASGNVLDVIAFPNPANQFIVFETMSDWESVASIDCYNVLGALMKPNVQFVGKQIHMDLSDFQNGQYHVVIRDNDGRILANKSIIKL